MRPFKFLYRFPQVSQLKGFSFSIPRVPGYGALVSGLTMEKVPSPFSCNCCVWWPWALWYLNWILLASHRKTEPIKVLGSGEGQKKTHFNPFWFLYAFSQPITGHLKGLCSSGIIMV